MTRCRICGRVIRKEPWVERGRGPTCWAKQNRKEYLKPLNVNDLCPRGWAWLIGDCNFAPDEGDCNDCTEPLAPIMKKVCECGHSKADHEFIEDLEHAQHHCNVSGCPCADYEEAKA